MKNINLLVLICITSNLLFGCASIQVTPQGTTVEIVNDKPQGNCNALGEVIGTQGNWFTGNYTSNENLMVGARNDLKNKAAALGGNVVYVQNISNASAYGSYGTTNTLIVGKVFKCKVGG